MLLSYGTTVVYAAPSLTETLYGAYLYTVDHMHTQFRFAPNFQERASRGVSVATKTIFQRRV